MGNTLGLGGKKRAKIMKINGETIKFKTPIQAKEVVKDYPGHVVLDSDSVKQYGIRAKPLEPFQNLEPKRLYFLVELPKFPNDHQHRTPRRVRSGIHMSAKDRLESLMLSRRSVSDLSIMRPATRVMVDGSGSGSGSESSQEISDGGVNSSGLRVRMKLPKAEVERLMNQSMDEHEVASKIVDLCLGKNGQNSINGNGNGNGNENRNGKGKEVVTNNVMLDQPFVRGNTGGYNKKRVGFSIREGEMGVVAS